MEQYTGEIAAFGAALCWTVGSQMVEAAGHRVGALAVNALRLVIALVFLCIWVAVATGQPWPSGYSGQQIAWLALSGLVGLFLGDLCLFRAFVQIGPRLAMLMMSLATPMTAVLGWLLLGERYGPVQWAGMFITLAGVAWVIVERPPEHLTTRAVEAPRTRRVRTVTMSGVVLGLGRAIGQALGTITAKHGMGDDGDPFVATQIRFAAAVIAFIPLLTIAGYWPRIGRAVRNASAMGFITAAAVIGSAMGVGLFLLAIAPTTIGRTTTGVATTIVSTVPILLIPFAIVVHREHVSWRAVVGALVAFAGVFLLVYNP